MKKHILQENYERFFGKREFGDPLHTFEDVMKKHQENKLKEDWWDNMNAASQAAYIKKHPGSKQAQQADADEDDYEMAPDMDSRDYDVDDDGTDGDGGGILSKPSSDQEVPDNEEDWAKEMGYDGGPIEDEYSESKEDYEDSQNPKYADDFPDEEKAEIEKRWKGAQKKYNAYVKKGVEKGWLDKDGFRDGLKVAFAGIPDEGGEEPSGEEKLDPQKIKDDYATAGENLTFSKEELDDAKATGDEEEISRIQSIVDDDRKEFVASRKTYYTANQEKIEDDYDTAEENMNFSRGELDDAKETGDEEEISRIQSTLDDDRKEFRKRRRELGRMEKAVGAKSPRTGNELNQETLMIDGKQYRRISEGKINSKFIKYRIYDKIADEINKVELDDFNLRNFNPLKSKIISFVEREVKKEKKMGNLSVLKQAFKKSDFEDKVFGRGGIIDGWYKKSEREFPKFLKKYPTYSDNPKKGWKNYNASSLTYGIGKSLYKIVDSLLDGINSLVPESKYPFSEFYQRFKK
jgi:hypothetical protein